eukprot:Skav215275  [mRNA]  locus=scaffold2881:276590:278641:- [translate_table: standard]
MENPQGAQLSGPSPSEWRAALRCQILEIGDTLGCNTALEEARGGIKRRIKRRNRIIVVSPRNARRLCEAKDKYEVAPCSTQSCDECVDRKWSSGGCDIGMLQSIPTHVAKLPQALRMNATCVPVYQVVNQSKTVAFLPGRSGRGPRGHFGEHGLAWLTWDSHISELP